MPTYEYRCKTCGEHLEAVQAFTDDALTTCPSCGAEALRKVFGSVGISFKGSGFYKNDSRSASHSSAKSHSNGSNGSNGSGGEGSSDSSSTSTATSTEGSSSKPSDKKPAGKAASPAKTDKGSGSSAGARSA